ncbi:MAG: hypothetical protein U1F43_34235 [Myxococcota bacterium]
MSLRPSVAALLLALPVVACDDNTTTGKDTSTPPDVTTEPPDTSGDTVSDITAPDTDVADTAPDKPGLGIDYGSTAAGAKPRFDLAGTDWMAIGWPSDHWRKADGHVTLGNLPAGIAGLIDTYIAFGENVLDGFGLNGAVYFQLDQLVDPSTWPAPDDTTAPDSLVQLVDVSVGPHRGERMPLTLHFHGLEFDPFYDPLTLALRPVNGFPLNEGDTYCAIVTRALKDAEGRYLSQGDGFAEALHSEPSLAPLVAWLVDSPLADKDIAVATCFTAQHATRELSQVADYIDSIESPELDSIFEPNVWGEFQGTYTAPNFQAGDKPYSNDGDGDIRFDTSGTPIVQADEEIRFLLMTPQDHAMPATGWPVTIYAHGTGGDYESCRGDTRELVLDGVAVLCIDQPLHGPRGPNGAAGPDLNEEQLVLYSFNFVNPYAGRSAFRQAAIDTILLSKMVADGRFALDAGGTKAKQALALDPDRISFFGHSHGGLSGTLALAVDDRLKAGVISGMAGLIIETILRRTDPADLRTLAASLIGVDPTQLNNFHPAMTLIQMLVDATDPVNYTRYWLHPMPGRNAKNVFVTEGTLDADSPSVGTDAATAAGGVPQVFPIAKISDGHRLRNMTPETLPISGNIDVGNGEVRTAAMRQWQGGSHFTAFTMADARALWRHFLYTASYADVPELGTGDVALTRQTPVSGADACADVRDIPSDRGFPIEIRANNALADATMDAGGCPSAAVGATPGAPGRDLVWRFTPPADGTYRFRIALPPAIDNQHPRFGPDMVTVSKACAAGSASQCVDTKTDGNLDLTLVAGTPVFVTVDGSSVTDVGPFTLVIEQRCHAVSCDGRECGTPAGACASCGSCGASETCTADGQCEARVLGDTCANPIVATTVPFVWTGDSRLFNNDTSYEIGCQSFPFILGRGSDDGVVRFTAPAKATYDFTLEADFDITLYVASQCDKPNETCLGADRTGGRSVHTPINLDAGETVYAIMDGTANSGNGAGHMALQIDTCVPHCEGRACGDDGCGGSCGECPDHGSCVESPGVCEIPYDCAPTTKCEAVPGDTCDQAFDIGQLPYSDHKDTAKFHPQYGYGYFWCPGVDQTYGFGASDVAYHFTAPKDGLYRFLLDTGEPPNVFDANLYLTTACDDIADSCLAADERDRNERLFRRFTAGDEAYVIVDGWSNFGDQTGQYTLDVRECVPSCQNRACGGDGCDGSCGGCGNQQVCYNAQCIPTWGLVCDNPRGVGDLPWHEDFGTGGYSPNRDNPCVDAPSGAASKDVVYAFQSRGAGDYTFRVTGNFPVQLYVTRGCGNGAECVASGARADVTLTADEVVYITIDGIDAPAAVEGNYTLVVEHTCTPQCDGKNCGADGCGGSCGTCAVPADVCSAEQVCTNPATVAGNTCASAFTVGALPFSGGGDTSKAWNEYLVDEAQCPGFVSKGVGSSDQVWSFTAPAAGDYVVEVVPHGWDAIVYALGDCANQAATCLAASDTQDVETMHLTLGQGETVSIVVDGAENIKNDAGPYELEVRAAE